MPRQGYVTRRQAPAGYVAVTRPLAKTLYEQGYAVTLCGNNVNSFHVFDGWHLGYATQKDNRHEAPEDRPTFDSIVGSFVSYLDKELGTYAVYYVKREDYRASQGWTPITSLRCRTCGEGGHQRAGQCMMCATRPSTAGK